MATPSVATCGRKTRRMSRGLFPFSKEPGVAFLIGRFCVVSDRGMIRHAMLAWLDKEQIPYILGARMGRVRKIKEKVLSANGNCRKVLPESTSSTDSSLFEDERFDGKWFLRTNTDFTPGQAALTYKEFWPVGTCLPGHKNPSWMHGRSFSGAMRPPGAISS